MRYRDRIVIQQETNTTDPDTRQPVKTWATFQTVRGNIEDAKAGERIITDTSRDVIISHTINLPSNSRTRQIKSQMRAIAAGVTYHIEAATDPKNRRRQIMLQVREVENPK